MMSEYGVSNLIEAPIAVADVALQNLANSERLATGKAVVRRVSDTASLLDRMHRRLDACLNGGVSFPSGDLGVGPRVWRACSG